MLRQVGPKAPVGTPKIDVYIALPPLANQPLPHQTQVLSQAVSQKRKRLWGHQYPFTAVQPFLLPEPPETWLPGPSPDRPLPSHKLCGCPTLLPVTLPLYRAARLYSCYLLAEDHPDTGQTPSPPPNATGTQGYHHPRPRHYRA